LKKIKLTIIYPIDPFGSKIGGIETCILSMIKHAPQEMDVELIGITENKKDRPLGKWLRLNYEGKPFKFFSVLYIPHVNRRSIIPLTLKFTLSLVVFRPKTTGRTLVFHRIEPALPYVLKENKKVLYIHHGDTREYLDPACETKWRYLPWLYFQMESRLITEMSKIYVVTLKGKEFYRKKYRRIANRFSFLPSWADPTIFYPYPEFTREQNKTIFMKRKAWREKTRLLLFAGRFESQKDPLLLVDVFRYVHSRYDGKVKLVLVGEGSLLGSVQKRIKEAGLERDAHFLGGLSQKEMAKIMNISDVLILTSFTEGLPRVVLEAQSCGLPVVSPDVGGVQMVIQDGNSGRIVQKRECSELGGAVLDVLVNRERFSIHNCLEAVKPFTAEQVLNQVYPYFPTLANGNPSQS